MKTNTPTLIVRQGDVLLRQLTELPANLTPAPKSERIILAHGESTGHHHSIPSYAANDYTTGGGARVVEVTTPTELVHQEHSAIPLPVATFAVERQREYTPSAIRSVAD